MQAVASGPLGGGIGERGWVVNATVHRDYDRLDPDAHLAEIASGLGLAGPGAGFLTAVDVRAAVTVGDSGVSVVATVGLGHPTWAAAPDEPAASDEPAGPDRPDHGSVGTINIVALVPALLSDAALVNAVGTVTEAKVQALWECGVAATGTASDAVFVGCAIDGPIEPFGGPRSTWGVRLARAVHQAVLTGTERWFRPTDSSRP